MHDVHVLVELPDVVQVAQGDEQGTHWVLSSGDTMEPEGHCR